MKYTGDKSRWRAVGIPAAVVAIYLAGCHIPLPGLDPDALAASGEMAPRLSIFTLGIVPYFTIVAYAEITKLIVPPLARWHAASERNAHRMYIILCVLALLVAAAQGLGVVTAVEAAGLTSPEPGGFIAQIAATVAGVAALIWLAGRIRLPGLGDGFWLLVILPFVPDLLSQIGGWIETARIGAASPAGLLAAIAFVVAALALAGFGDMILHRNFVGEDAGRDAWAEILLWPPFLAGIVSGHLLTMAMILAPQSNTSASAIDAFSVVTIILLIPLFVLGYARRREAQPAINAEKGDARSVLLAIAGIQIILAAGAVLLPRLVNLPANLNGGVLIAFAAVMLAIRRAWMAGGATFRR